MNPKHLFGQLVDGLRLLASDFEAQTRSLPSFVHVPDEVAMGFGEAFLVADQVLEAGLIDETAWKMMKALSDYLDKMSDDTSLWTLEALKEHQSWTEARRKAREVLEYLHQQLGTVG